MKKNFKFYALIWAILLAAWCAVVFLVRPIIPGYIINYDTRFWITFVFIVATFIGNLLCAFFAFKAETFKKMFLNLSLITVSWSALIAMLGIGMVVMLIPSCPAWIASIICIIVLAFNSIFIIMAAWAPDTVHNADEKIKSQTLFIKNLTVDAESIFFRAKSDVIKTECKKLCEAVRYSDPMSNEALSVIEAKITVKMDELYVAVEADDVQIAKELADEIIILVGDRNRKCKALK